VVLNNINLTTWINMSKSLALNCRGRFFHPDEIHTSASLKPVDIHYSCWQTEALANFFIMIKYSLQLVENLATYTIVVDNLRLLNILHPDKISTSACRNRATSILFNIILHPDKIPTSPCDVRRKI